VGLVSRVGAPSVVGICVNRPEYAGFGQPLVLLVADQFASSSLVDPSGALCEQCAGGRESAAEDDGAEGEEAPVG